MKKILLIMPFMAMTLTQAQVSLVKDISPGPATGMYQGKLDAAVINNQLIFTANNFATGSFLNVWKSDGTESGTNVLHEIVPVSQGFDGNAQNFYYSSNLNKIIFLGNNGGSTTINTLSLFVTDGTTQGLESLSGTNYVFNTVNIENNFIDFANKVFFNLGLAPPSDGYELYSTDGTESGTGLVKDIVPGIGSADPKEFTVFNSQLYFSATDPTNGGRELWRTDGTGAGTNLFIDIFPGNTNSSNPLSLTVFNNKLYFVANDGTNGRELWVTDGTIAGTQMVFDLYAGATSSNPENLTVYNNALYFTASNPTLGTEIFKMTTAQNITNLKNIASGSGSSNPENLHVFNGTLYFSADDGVNGIELWSSTGFPSTTNLLKNINTSPSSPDSNPSGFTAYFGELYFAANDGINGRELWKTDGTNSGTVLVSNINPSGDSNPSDLIVANNRLFFSANDGTTGIELWKYEDSTLSLEQIDNKGFDLFPNPTNNSFTIKTNKTIQNITIFDIQGKIMKSFDAQLDTYSIQELNSGLYFVKIKSDKVEITKKIIKQ